MRDILPWYVSGNRNLKKGEPTAGGAALADRNEPRTTRAFSTYPHANLVIGISFLADAVRDWINHVNLEEIRRRCISVVQGLFFNV